MKIAYAIGWVNTRILLIVFFYLVVAPIGLFARIIGKDLLELKIDRGAPTYWIKRPQRAMDIRQYEKQF